MLSIREPVSLEILAPPAIPAIHLLFANSDGTLIAIC